MTRSVCRKERAVGSSVWQVQEAKAHFSEVVDAATRGKPQRVTRRGKDAVVIVSARMFDALSRAAQSGAPTFARHLLAIPKEKSVPPRAALKLRDVAF
jgi:antitoxin Phd